MIPLPGDIISGQVIIIIIIIILIIILVENALGLTLRIENMEFNDDLLNQDSELYNVVKVSKLYLICPNNKSRKL